MKVALDNEEVPVLTSREAAVLLALAGTKLTGYEIARQCEDDSAGQLGFSNGTLYPVLKRMMRHGLIEGATPYQATTGRNAQLYTLTQLGRMFLEWRLAEYRRMVRLGEKRL